METLIDSAIESSIAKSFAIHKEAAQSLRKEPIASRKQRLKKLRDWIHKNRSVIHSAMYDDFRKHPTEVDGIEIFHVLSEIKKAVDNLDQWTALQKIDATFTMLGTRSFIQYEPRGVCLIISPWNYPFSLCAGPLASALAAGNAVVLKPSELTPHVSSVLKKMVTEIFDPAVVSIFEGGPEISQTLLKLPFDHIFFTGSPSVGKIVMRAASENLSSVTLELGGKSPAIITSSANLKDAAERTAVAKFVNNGQTCIAPDYILADKQIADQFTIELIRQTKKLFTEKGQTFEDSPHYCRIVNTRHFDRVNNLLKDAVEQGATLAFGGKVNAGERFIHPVILTDVSPSTAVMQEEIFGPVLPIIRYEKLEEAISFVNGKPKPLALYVFSRSKRIYRKVLQETSSGGACVNDCAIQFLHGNLPFGGVNNSGIGKSHGYSGFLAFSNEKPVLRQRSGLTSVKAFYPPYTAGSRRLIEWFLKLF
jgi:aldehyde dehydrogenase (NAD+)